MNISELSDMVTVIQYLDSLANNVQIVTKEKRRDVSNLIVNLQRSFLDNALRVEIPGFGQIGNPIEVYGGAASVEDAKKARNFSIYEPVMSPRPNKKEEAVRVGPGSVPVTAKQNDEPLDPDSKEVRAALAKAKKEAQKKEKQLEKEAKKANSKDGEGVYDLPPDYNERLAKERAELAGKSKKVAIKRASEDSE